MGDPTETDKNWLWWLLFAGIITLALQLMPAAWWGAFSVLDVRRWTWRGYAVCCAIAIVALVIVRAWLNARNAR